MGAIWFVYIVLLTIGIMIGKLINRVAPVRVNSAAVGATFMVPMVIFQLTTIFSEGSAMVNASPEKQGEMIGYLLGPALIMFFLTAVLGIREQKHRALTR